MKLYDILTVVDPMHTDVRFIEESGERYDPIHITSSNINELYLDWWDEAMNCPENGTFIYGMTFYTYEGKSYTVDNAELFEYTFEAFMKDIGDFFYDHKTHQLKRQK